MRTLTRIDGRNLALGRGEIGPGAAAADLIVDQTHPFFYDHPLDHVPGILLIEGALQLARAWSAAVHGAPPRLEGFCVDFRRYCLHGDPVALRLEAADPRRPQVELIQNGVSRALVSLRLAEAGAPAGDPGPAVAPGPDLPETPACPAALNKTDPANVMIGEPRLDRDGWRSRLLPADGGNALADPVGAAEWHPLTLLEAFMQVLRFRNRRDPEAGRMRDILQGVDMTILRPARRDESLWLFCAEDVRAEGRRLVRSGFIASGNQVLARVAVRTARAATQPRAEDDGRRERAGAPALAEGVN